MQRYFKFLRIILNHSSALYEFIKVQSNPGTFQTHWSEENVLVKFTIISQVKAQHSPSWISMHGCSSQLIQPPAGTAAPERPEHITNNIWTEPLKLVCPWASFSLSALPKHDLFRFFYSWNIQWMTKGQSTFLVWKPHSFYSLFASQSQENGYDPRQDNFLPQPGNITRVSGKLGESKWWVSLTRQVILCAAKCITRIYAPLFQTGHQNSFISMKQLSSWFLCS